MSPYVESPFDDYVKNEPDDDFGHAFDDFDVGPAVEDEYDDIAFHDFINDYLEEPNDDDL